MEAFCQTYEEVDQAPSPEVGSEEHVSELTRLADAAPPDIADVIGTVRDYVRDQVSPNDPDSQNADAYPENVQAAVREVEQFVRDNCQP